MGVVSMFSLPRSAREGERVAVGLLVFAVVWLVHLASTSLSPPTDNIEQLTWVHSLEWGYYKHPPLPTWLIWLPARLFGANEWTSYATGAVFTLGSIALLWRLLRRLRGPAYAALAVLAVLCITYYNGRLYYYNHNVVLMFCATASLLLCWQANRTAQRRWWAALGVALGLGALAKYQIAVTVVSVLAFWLHRRGWRDARQREGLLTAALTALVVFAPHLVWLRTHAFGPIDYATQSSLGAGLAWQARCADSLHWLVDQLLNRAVPAWLLIAIAVWATRRRVLRTDPPPARETGAAPDPSSRALLLIWGVVPMVFMPAVGILIGADLQLQWGTAFLLFAVPAVMELIGHRVMWSNALVRAALPAFVSLQALLLGLSYLTSPSGPAAFQDHHWRSFDSEALAQLVEEPARGALRGGRICVVSGPAASAGALALQLADRPLVLIDGRLDQSPWVPAERVRDCGLLELSEGPAPAGSQPLGKTFQHLSWRVVQPLDRQGAALDWP